MTGRPQRRLAGILATIGIPINAFAAVAFALAARKSHGEWHFVTASAAEAFAVLFFTAVAIGCWRLPSRDEPERPHDSTNI